MEVKYHFTPKVEAAIAENRATILNSRKLGIITSRQALDMHTGFVARCLSEGRVEETNPDRPVAARCAECGVGHILPASRKYFCCDCSPRVDRPVSINRIPLV